MILLGSALVSAPGAFAAGPCTPDATALDTEETAFLRLINEYRARNGLGPLAASPSLRRSSAWLSNDMATRNYFSHVDGFGRHASDRARDCAYPSSIGENIAAGTESDTAAEAFALFLNSREHRENMLDRRYRFIGIARAMNTASTYVWYWTTDFGLDDDPASAGAAGEAAQGSNQPTNAQGAAPATGAVRRAADSGPFWVNDLAYGSAGGGFYWDAASNQVWTRERNWHTFSPSRARRIEPLWVDDLDYGSAGGGFYLDPATGQVWTAERGWHVMARR